MKDFIKDFQGEKTHIEKNHILSLVAVSFVLAIGIHISLKDTNFGTYMKASVLEGTVGTENNIGDISVEKNDNEIVLKANKIMKLAHTFSCTLSYNGENVGVRLLNSLIPNSTVESISNTPGISTIIVTSENNQDIKEGDILLKIGTTKKQEKIEHMNITNANFTDVEGQIYELSSSGIDF